MSGSLHFFKFQITKFEYFLTLKLNLVEHLVLVVTSPTLLEPSHTQVFEWQILCLSEIIILLRNIELVFPLPARLLGILVVVLRCNMITDLQLHR